MKLLILFIALFSLLSFAEDVDKNSQVRNDYHSVRLDSPEELLGLDAEQRIQLLQTVRNNPIAKLSMVSHYDPEGLTGFCFGRSLTVHMVARQMGLSERSIKKLFIVGDLRQGPDPEWRFHVTTLVKGSEDGHLYAIDPIMRPPTGPGTPMRVEDWIATVKRTWDITQSAQLYLTDVNVVAPDMTVFPVTKDDETGERLIELSFDPSTKPGISMTDLGGQAVNQLDRLAEEKFMIGVEEAVPFHFLSMGMTLIENGEQSEYLFDFRGYFPDLMGSLLNPQTPLVMDGFEFSEFADASHENRNPADLHGFRVPSSRRLNSQNHP